MLYSIPDYYKEFVCTADQCEDTCCASWQIMVDRKSLDRYHCVRGAFKKDLRRGINWKEGTFRQSKEKRCAFLDEDNFKGGNSLAVLLSGGIFVITHIVIYGLVELIISFRKR